MAPCHCAGAQRWVHARCLEELRAKSDDPHRCELCGAIFCLPPAPRRRGQRRRWGAGLALGCPGCAAWPEEGLKSRASVGGMQLYRRAHPPFMFDLALPTRPRRRRAWWQPLAIAAALAAVAGGVFLWAERTGRRQERREARAARQSRRVLKRREKLVAEELKLVQELNLALLMGVSARGGRAGRR